MGQSILANGKMINRKAMAKKNGKMVPTIGETTDQAKNKEREYLYGAMIAHMKVSFLKITYMAKVSICGKMVECTMANGIIIKCMEKAYSPGRMVESTKGNMKMIKSRGSEFSRSETGESMKESGRMESSMAVEYIRKRRCLDREFGIMELE